MDSWTRQLYLAGALVVVVSLWMLSRTERGGAVLAGAVDAVGSALKPRGIRNNNPGNLVRTSIAWRGKVATRADADRLGLPWDSTFEVFEHAKFGVRAMAKDLLNDAAEGKVTIDALVREFSHTDQAVYIANLVARLGIGAKDRFNVRGRLPELVAGMIRQENGQQPYSDAQLREWVYLA